MLIKIFLTHQYKFAKVLKISKPQPFFHLIILIYDKNKLLYPTLSISFLNIFFFF